MKQQAKRGEPTQNEASSSSSKIEQAFGTATPLFTVRPALPHDVLAISAVVMPYATRGILLTKELVGFYEAVQEFWVAEVHGSVVGCGALHVMWEDLAEVRTLAVDGPFRGTGVGHALLERLLERARELEIPRVFCLTFEVDFFERHGFTALPGPGVPEPIYGQLLRSSDDGVAEFLELSRVKANTLGNTRMIAHLDELDDLDDTPGAGA